MPPHGRPLAYLWRVRLCDKGLANCWRAVPSSHWVRGWRIARFRLRCDHLDGDKACACVTPVPQVSALSLPFSMHHPPRCLCASVKECLIATEFGDARLGQLIYAQVSVRFAH